jgi:hypothetical protein
MTSWGALFRAYKEPDTADTADTSPPDRGTVSRVSTVRAPEKVELTERRSVSDVRAIGADSPELIQGDDLVERSAIIEEGAGVPREWADGFARLCSMAIPEGVPVHRWRQLIDNAGRFIDCFAVQAHQLGWDTASVFGCHPHRPDARLNLQGMIWLIGDGELVAIGETTARIKTRTGSALTYRRRPVDRREPVVAAWELIREVR